MYYFMHVIIVKVNFARRAIISSRSIVWWKSCFMGQFTGQHLCPPCLHCQFPRLKGHITYIVESHEMDYTSVKRSTSHCDWRQGNPMTFAEGTAKYTWMPDSPAEKQRQHSYHRISKSFRAFCSIVSFIVAKTNLMFAVLLLVWDCRHDTITRLTGGIHSAMPD